MAYARGHHAAQLSVTSSASARFRNPPLTRSHHCCSHVAVAAQPLPHPLPPHIPAAPARLPRPPPHPPPPIPIAPLFPQAPLPPLATATPPPCHRRSSPPRQRASVIAVSSTTIALVAAMVPTCVVACKTKHRRGEDGGMGEWLFSNCWIAIQWPEKKHPPTTPPTHPRTYLAPPRVLPPRSHRRLCFATLPWVTQGCRARAVWAWGRVGKVGKRSPEVVVTGGWWAVVGDQNGKREEKRRERGKEGRRWLGSKSTRQRPAGGRRRSRWLWGGKAKQRGEGKGDDNFVIKT